MLVDAGMMNDIKVTIVSRKKKHMNEWKYSIIPGQSVKLPYAHYCQTSNINQTLVGIRIVDHSDVVGTSPVGAAPTASSFST